MSEAIYQCNKLHLEKNQISKARRTIAQQDCARFKQKKPNNKG